MNHNFNIKVATELGVHAAIILSNLEFWIVKNKANETNKYDGNYWTYNSKKAFAELFPYMTNNQIDYALKKLIEKELIITGNYNKSAYDRTLWYAITKKGYSILENSEMEEIIFGNGNEEIQHPIPNNKQNDKQQIKNKDKERKKESTYDEIIKDNFNNQEVISTLYEFVKMRKLIKKPLTDFALKKLCNKLKSFTLDDKEQVKILEQSILNNWQDIYKLKDNKQEENKKVSGFSDIAERFETGNGRVKVDKSGWDNLDF